MITSKPLVIIVSLVFRIEFQSFEGEALYTDDGGLFSLKRIGKFSVEKRKGKKFFEIEFIFIVEKLIIAR